MNHRIRLLSLALFAVPVLVQAQAVPMAPTNVLSIFRESVKVGKDAAHDAHETAWAGAMAAAKSPNKFIAMRSLTGPNEIWYISAFPTWADYEKSNDAYKAHPELAEIQKKFSGTENEYLNDARGMTLRPRTELGYGASADLPHMRYMSVTRISVRPGHAAEYEEGRKLAKAAHEAAHLTDHYSIWESTSGAPGSTFYQFTARKTLAELDSTATIHGAAYLAALGGDEGQKKLAALQASAVISQEVDHFEFVPSQSVPPDEWVTANPDMWKRKAMAGKAPAKKAPEKKTP
jgi:hypothetical protein